MKKVKGKAAPVLRAQPIQDRESTHSPMPQRPFPLFLPPLFFP